MEAIKGGEGIDANDIERFRYFVENVKDYAIYMLSPSGHVQSWNAGAQHIKGYDANEIIGQHFSKFYTPDDQATDVPAKALQTAETTGKFEAEGWRVRKDGTHFWASVVIDAIYDDQGKLIGFAKITRDVTARKKAQDALRASEEQFQLLVQGVTDYAIYMLSPAGVITNWNAGAERIKGYTKDEVVGTHFSRFYTEEDRTAGLPLKALEIAASEGRFESEGLRIRKDGTKFWTHVIIDLIKDASGVPIGFAKVTRDITEKREAAVALEKAKEALFHSQKLESIGKLTGGVAHDFNNFLGVIVNGIEILSKEAKSPAIDNTLEAMERAATRAAALTQQLLSFARQQPLRQGKHNLNRVIIAFEAVLRRACKETITFDLQMDQQLNAVLIDPIQFESAILNLASNADDAMPNGGVLTIVTENVHLAEQEVGRLPADHYVKVTMKDNGVGMTPDIAARAIEPFYTTKPPGRGTGLGLSQVYGLIQQSKGDISIHSRVGEGTSLSLYLPALKEVTDTSGSVLEDDIDSTEKALVVDDDTNVLDTTITLFKNMGYEVLSANNGADAIEIMKRVPSINILFTDVVMPGMDGVTLGKEARKLLPGIKVILASGFALNAMNDSEYDFAGFDFLSKPYRMAEVMKLLRKP